MKKREHYIKDAFRTAWFFRIICSCGEQFIGFTANQAQWAYREHIQKVYGLLPAETTRVYVMNEVDTYTTGGAHEKA